MPLPFLETPKLHRSISDKPRAIYQSSYRGGDSSHTGPSRPPCCSRGIDACGSGTAQSVGVTEINTHFKDTVLAEVVATCSNVAILNARHAKITTMEGAKADLNVIETNGTGKLFNKRLDGNAQVQVDVVVRL